MSISTCPSLRRIESIKCTNHCPGLLYDTNKKFAFGRMDTLKLLNINRCSKEYNLLQVYDEVWDENLNTNYLQCAINSESEIHIFFLNNNNLNNNLSDLEEIFENDLERKKTTTCNTVFAYELAQFITCGYKLTEKIDISTKIIRYTLKKDENTNQETEALKNVLQKLFPNCNSLNGGKRKITILGRSRNIHYIRAKNGRITEYVKVNGILVKLKSIKK
jgi:hypothetical protein